MGKSSTMILSLNIPSSIFIGWMVWVAARDRALHGQQRAIVEATFGTWAEGLMVR